MTAESFSLGIDIGGTFTDIVLYSHEQATVFSHKELTTPLEPTDGAIRGIEILLARERIAGGSISRVIHATTLFTNALIQRRGVKTGIITTAGFRDTLELRREYKYDLYDLFIEIPKALIPREARLEVIERMRADGSVDQALDEAGVVKAGSELVSQGIESVAVVFLHSYANAAHERRARDILQERYPRLHVSISCEVSPQIREFERTSTTAANAYVAPIADRYLASLDARLKGMGITCPLLMMLSNGGLTHVGEARRFPIQLLESGPAAGAIAAAYFGQRSDTQDILAFDMGGTTAKLSIVEGNQPLIAHHFEAGREKRFAPGSGLPINISTVELIEIGAGGGSIAHLDSMRLLKVGPNSAGSRPGPACYGLGGTEPTVTDADLLLGHLDAETFAGGTMKLSQDSAARAIGNVAGALALDAEKVADGIVAVVNENMAAAARVHVAERGFDASHFVMLVTGGGGPLHGCDVARRLGIKRVICPPGAGVASAVGLLIAPARVDRAMTIARTLGNVTPQELEIAFMDLECDAGSVIKDTLTPGASHFFERLADIRFVGQGFEIVTHLPDGPYGEDTPAQIKARFAAAYERVFGQLPPVGEIELINLRVSAIERLGARPLNLSPSGKEAWQVGRGSRLVWNETRGIWRSLRVVARDALEKNKVVNGPLIVEDASSTLVIPDGARARCDASGNLIVDLDACKVDDAGQARQATSVIA